MHEDSHTSSSGRLIALGEIVGTHGVRGLLRFHPYGHATSPLPTDRILYLIARPLPGGQPDATGATPIVVEAVRPHGGVSLLQIEGVATIEAATPFVGRALALPERDLPAPAPNELYVYQLEGLEVVTESGDRVGTIDRSFSTGANEVLVVRDGTREHLIPLIADVVRSIDLAGRRVVIEPMDGLLE